MKILTVVLIMLVALPAISIATMIYGWGLAPLSWWWIVGGYVGIMICTIATQAIKP